jgi:hypothetical protein
MNGFPRAIVIGIYRVGVILDDTLNLQKQIDSIIVKLAYKFLMLHIYMYLG